MTTRWASTGASDVSGNGSPSDLANRFARHSETLRGVLRHHLVARQLALHVPPPPARVLDVGGGSGRQAIPLARAGYELTILDESADMLAQARQRLALEEPAVSRRVSLINGSAEDVLGQRGQPAFDVVLCHGVLMYVDDPVPLIRALVSALDAGGLVSILFKNAAAMAMRPALERRWADALAALDMETETGRLGIASRGHHLADIAGASASSPTISATKGYPMRRSSKRLRSWSGRLQDAIPTARWPACCTSSAGDEPRYVKVIAHRGSRGGESPGPSQVPFACRRAFRALHWDRL
ncbi:MAG: class I SAM-dependent methyltransferase [Chloroflexota bacterium]